MYITNFPKNHYNKKFNFALLVSINCIVVAVAFFAFFDLR